MMLGRPLDRLFIAIILAEMVTYSVNLMSGQDNSDPQPATSNQYLETSNK